MNKIEFYSTKMQQSCTFVEIPARPVRRACNLWMFILWIMKEIKLNYGNLI